MKTMKNGISSVKTVRNAFYGVKLLTAEQQEALAALFAAIDPWEKGVLEINVGDSTLTLNLQGRLCRGEMADIKESADKVLAGKVDLLVENVLKREVLSYLKHRFEGAEQTLSYGLMRNTLERRIRHYAVRRSAAQCKEERIALTQFINWLENKNTCRKMLNLCGKLQSISVNTYEYVGGGRYRVAILTPERK